MKVSMVGTGWAAADHASKLIGKPEIQLVAVCGSCPKHTADFAMKFSFGMWFNDFDDMLRAVTCDALIIASTPDAHLRQIQQAISSVDTLIVEKPLTTTYEEALIVRKTVADAGSSIAVVYQNRLNHSYAQLQQLFGASTAEVESLEIHYNGLRNMDYFRDHGAWRRSRKSAGGGVLIQNGIHWVNQILPLFNYEYSLERVQAQYREGVDTECYLAMDLHLGLGGVPATFTFSRMHPTSDPEVLIRTHSNEFRMTDLTLQRRSFSLTNDKEDFSGPRGTTIDLFNLLMEGRAKSTPLHLFLDDAICDLRFIRDTYAMLSAQGVHCG